MVEIWILSLFCKWKREYLNYIYISRKNTEIGKSKKITFWNLKQKYNEHTLWPLIRHLYFWSLYKICILESYSLVWYWHRVNLSNAKFWTILAVRMPLTLTLQLMYLKTGTYHPRITKWFGKSDLENDAGLTLPKAASFTLPRGTVYPFEARLTKTSYLTHYEICRSILIINCD